MKSSFLIVLVMLFHSNPKLNQDVAYAKAEEIKVGIGETCEVITSQDMIKAKNILQTYWNKNLGDSTWSSYNRQYLVYNSNSNGTVVYINGCYCGHDSAYLANNWILGMAEDKLYYTAFVNLKKKKVNLFEWNTYK